MMIVMALVGTSILKKHREPLFVGIFIGMTAIMSASMLLIAVITEGEARRKSSAKISRPSAYAVIFFSVVEFVLLGIFSFLLYKNVDEIYAVNDIIPPPPQPKPNPEQSAKVGNDFAIDGDDKSEHAEYMTTI